MTDLRIPLIAAAAMMLLALAPAVAGAQNGDNGADRPMATRADLEAFVSRAESDRRADQQALARARTRLAEGDFRAGDRIWLSVQNDTALSDTFAVWHDQSLRLPSPTVGSLSLAGTLRSELEPRLQAYVARFVRNPTVRARPLVRISVQGEVRNAGYYAVPADAEVAEVFMVAGGTTPNARPDLARIDRLGSTYVRAEALESAVAGGRTLDDLGVREGDQFTMPKRSTGLVDVMRFSWLAVSLTLGVMALSKAF